MQQSKSELQSRPSYWTIARNAGLAGTIAGASSEGLMYGLDSYKTQIQQGQRIQLSRLFRGMLPVLCIGAGPSFGSFFLTYAPVKHACEQSGSSVLAVTVASLVCAVPSTFVIVPSDVIKKRLVLGIDTSVGAAVTRIWQESGFAGFFVGWRANLAMNMPFAVVKMGFYETCVAIYKTAAQKEQLSALESAGAGLVSGAATGLVTTPLDVVNTQLKSGTLKSTGLVAAHFELARTQGIRALFQGAAPRVLLLGLGSSIFWAAYNRVAAALEGQ